MFVFAGSPRLFYLRNWSLFNPLLKITAQHAKKI
ncbi:hypothetical protein CKO_02003 [Citrobacter koseri ATCC BAA-895]|uniref:Uncharacterized protein n=1 Tax=Citrobacter koseri (strain ATCC BAA-895 / CDC 4225-83 / SGSC4696) TaxID=290338 RepID=A8AI16_CITK8|nr:hypothetical protein CKO_02003 [Citrobacter koseri ATCC BAA-895]